MKKDNTEGAEDAGGTGGPAPQTPQKAEVFAFIPQACYLLDP
jgi:hypothetical protein